MILGAAVLSLLLTVDVVEQACPILGELKISAIGICSNTIHVYSPNCWLARRKLERRFPKSVTGIDWYDDSAVSCFRARFYGLGAASSGGSTKCTKPVVTPLSPGDAIGTCSKDALTLGAIIKKGNVLRIVSTDHGIKGMVGKGEGLISANAETLIGIDATPPLDASTALVEPELEVCPEAACTGTPYKALIQSSNPPRDGDPVAKCGMATDSTMAEIECADLCVWAKIQGQKKFLHAILIRGSGFADDGDSGSVVFRPVGDEGAGEVEALGLLFARSGNAHYSLAEPMKRIFDNLPGFDFIKSCQKSPQPPPP